MKKVIRIDANSLFLEDVLLEDRVAIPSDCIEIPCRNGFYKPEWNGTEWVEGATQEYIDSVTKLQLQPPTTEERLQAAESAISILMGV